MINFDDILSEWSYRLPKGYPTVVDCKFVDRDEMIILNQILQEHNIEPLELQETILQELVTMTQLSSNPTDIKEALVCLFVDAISTDKQIADLYRSGLDKKLDTRTRTLIAKQLKKTLKPVASKYGKNYGITGYAMMPDYISDSILNFATSKKDIVIINNGLGAAEAIVGAFSKIKPGMVHRDASFEAIRNHAVKLIETNYGIKGYYPDNWCPGDIYFYLKGDVSKVLSTKSLNVGSNSLNSYFYGSNNTKGSILAVSLKMQEAQAGKGTTFLKNVVVDGISAADKQGKSSDTKAIIKFRDIKRRLQKYYFDSDQWLKEPGVFNKVKSAITQLAKTAGMQNVPVKSGQQKDLVKWLKANKKTVQLAIKKVDSALQKSTNAVTIFQQSYTRFVKDLKDKNIVKVEGDSKTFLKDIEDRIKKDSGGKLDQAKLQAILAQKAATYDLASTLIEKWTEKTKTVSPAFAEHLTKVKNPFVAITLFAIAQHGLNPNFYKAIGTNNATIGTISEFPSNSQIDENKTVSTIKINDSPGQAGFVVNYILTINNHKYKTSLVFRFSKDQIRVEVEELTQI